MKIAIIDSGIPCNIEKSKSINISIESNFKIIYDDKNIYDENGHGSKVYQIIENYIMQHDEIFSIKILDNQLIL